MHTQTILKPTPNESKVQDTKTRFSLLALVQVLMLVFLIRTIGTGAADTIASSVHSFTETINGSNFEMIEVKGGSFQMGCLDGFEDEKPVHLVTLSDYYIGKTEVTVSQFEAFVEATRYQTDADKNTGSNGSWIFDGTSWVQKEGLNWQSDVNGNPRLESEMNHPVIHISWNDAIAYCEWLSNSTGKTYRLPTEADWEYASGGGRSSKRTKWSGTNNDSILDSYAWFFKTV